jgi:hypothetical protein
VFSTRTNRLEVDLDAVEQKQAEVASLREAAGNNIFKRFAVQVKRRQAFLATPPILWLFIVILGVFSALSLCVSTPHGLSLFLFSDAVVELAEEAWAARLACVCV